MMAEKKQNGILSFFKKMDPEDHSKTAPNSSDGDDHDHAQQTFPPEKRTKVCAAVTTADTASNSNATSRSFQKWWRNTYKWLVHDDNANLVYCSLCIEKKDTIFFQGTNKFRTNTLMRHETCAAMQETSEAAQAKQAFCRALEGKDGAIMAVVKSVYWIVLEGIAIHKFGRT